MKFIAMDPELWFVKRIKSKEMASINGPIIIPKVN